MSVQGFEHLAGMTPDERERWRRWNAPMAARVTHPDKGTAVVPCLSKFSAIQNAAELWGCRWIEILETAGVWAVEPEDKPAKMPLQKKGGG